MSFFIICDIYFVFIKTQKYKIYTYKYKITEKIVKCKKETILMKL